MVSTRAVGVNARSVIVARRYNAVGFSIQSPGAYAADKNVPCALAMKLLRSSATTRDLLCVDLPAEFRA